MTRKQKPIFFIILIGIIALCALVFGSAYRLWQKPLGPELELAKSTYPPITFPPTWTPDAANTPRPWHPATGTPGMVISTPTVPVPLCGGPPQMIILAIGSDQRGDMYNYGLGDVVRLVRVDFLRGEVSVMSFPRDLYLEIPGISDHYGITHGKLNQAYLYGNEGFGYYDGADAGPGLMARTLNFNFGANPDRYIAVNMQTFVRIVNAVDGVTVTLDKTVDGRPNDQPDRKDLIFYAGTRRLDGKQALQLARLRPEGTFGRTSAQNQILCGLYDKLTSPDVIGDIPKIISSFKNSVQTDLSPAELSQLTCLGSQLTGADITFYNWEEDFFYATRIYDEMIGGNTYILQTNFAYLAEYVADFERGQWRGLSPQSSEAGDGLSTQSFCD